MVDEVKDQIRKEMLEKRERSHTHGGHVHCLDIMEHVVHMPEFVSAKKILLYASKGSEAHTDGIMQTALAFGKSVALPVTKKESKALELYWVGMLSGLKAGAFGILEPPENPEQKAAPEEMDLVIVPGVSFDRRGHRIGYGMGYYDSLLSKMKCPKIGLAYEVQIVPHVPDEPHDVAVDKIVTEKGIIDCKNGNGNGAAGKEIGVERENGSPAAGAKAENGKFRIAVLASGRGSDFQSIIDAKKRGEIDIEIAGLITDNLEAKAIERAKENNIPAFVIVHSSREELDSGIKKKLDELAPDLVVLAGYMKIIKSKELFSSYAGRIINIHPSLLPKYPGAHAQKDAFDAGEKVSGYTVHFVDETLDGGKIILQEKVDISACKTWEEASLAILEREHIGLPKVVGMFAKGEIKLGA
ncbi:MAG: phosphoribosylglycinamide formyltransferase [Candidatus Micrarchaeia archaeon]